MKDNTTLYVVGGAAILLLGYVALSKPTPAPVQLPPTPPPPTNNGGLNLGGLGGVITGLISLF